MKAYKGYSKLKKKQKLAAKSLSLQSFIILLNIRLDMCKPLIKLSNIVEIPKYFTGFTMQLPCVSVSGSPTLVSLTVSRILSRVSRFPFFLSVLVVISSWEHSIPYFRRGWALMFLGY